MENEQVEKWLQQYRTAYNRPGEKADAGRKISAYEYASIVEGQKYGRGGDELEGTPQFRAIVGRESEMKPNDAGGYGFKVSDRTILDRFLVIGSETNRYYVKSEELTFRTVPVVRRMLDTDGMWTVDRIVAVSTSGRPISNNSCLFAMALAMAHPNLKLRAYAARMAYMVVRTGAHLFQFMTYLHAMRGHGATFNNMLRHWYNDKQPELLAYQVGKYQRRGKWSHADILRLAKPKPHNIVHDAVYAWVTKGINGMAQEKIVNLPRTLIGMEMIHACNDPALIAKIILDYRLTWEFVPVEKLSGEAWSSLAMVMPLNALVRWLSTMTRNGTLGNTDTRQLVIERITDQKYIHDSRMHPVSLLIAWHTYKNSISLEPKSETSWSPIQEITDALEKAFYMSFANVEPNNKRHLIAIDISGSMSTQIPTGKANRYMPISMRDAAAALALVAYRTEPNARVVAFSSGHKGKHESYNGITELPINRNTDLNGMRQLIDNLGFYGTDCALPMVYATNKNLEVDVFSIFTDSETWAGRIHPSEALIKYRRIMNINAKLVICGMEMVDFSLADPNDPGQLDVIGFSPDVPRLISNFAIGFD